MNIQQFIEVAIVITVLYGGAVFIVAKTWKGKR